MLSGAGVGGPSRWDSLTAGGGCGGVAGQDGADVVIRAPHIAGAGRRGAEPGELRQRRPATEQLARGDPRDLEEVVRAGDPAVALMTSEPGYGE